MLRSGALAAVAAAFLHLGLITGSSPARADIFSLRKFSIPSTSMAPTLLINEYIVTVNWPRVSRGDLVVYLLPKDNSTIYIKRVIGMPGDRIRMIEGRLHINGERVAREALADFELRDAYDKPQPVRDRETLPGGRSHRILEVSDSGFSTTPGIRRAGRSLFHDGRQPGQFVRQPDAGAARHCAGRRYRRPSGTGLFLVGRGRKRLDVLALALVGAMEPHVCADRVTACCERPERRREPGLTRLKFRTPCAFRRSAPLLDEESNAEELRKSRARTPRQRVSAPASGTVRTRHDAGIDDKTPSHVRQHVRQRRQQPQTPVQRPQG